MRDIPGGLGQVVDLRFDSFPRGHGTMLWNGYIVHIIVASPGHAEVFPDPVMTVSLSLDGQFRKAVPHEAESSRVAILAFTPRRCLSPATGPDLRMMGQLFSVSWQVKDFCHRPRPVC